MHAPSRVRAAGLVVILAAAVSISAPAPAHAYSHAGARWPSTTITYANQAPGYASAVRHAVRVWNQARVGVRFRRAPAATARVVFRYARLARGFGPTGCEGISGGTAPGWPGPFFRALRVQVIRNCRSEAIRRLTAAHELGHVLGLGHENRRCALMNSTGGVRTGVGLQCPQRAVARLRRRHLTRDDVLGARALYRNAFRFRTADRSIALFNPDESILAFTPRPYGFSAASRNHALTYRWGFGDPGSGSANRVRGLDVLHAFPRGGTYTITLEVLDGGTVIARERKRLTLF